MSEKKAFNWKETFQSLRKIQKDGSTYVDKQTGEVKPYSTVSRVKAALRADKMEKNAAIDRIKKGKSIDENKYGYLRKFVNVDSKRNG